MKKARFVLQVFKFVDGGRDHLNNVLETWAPAEDWPVYSYHSGASPEAVLQGRETSTVAYTIYAPAAGYAPVGRDEVMIGGFRYQVDGETQDWTTGPFSSGLPAGLEVRLKKRRG